MTDLSVRPDVVKAALASVPMRYNITTDECVPVTQDWVDGVQKLLNKFGLAREAARRAIDVKDGIVVTAHPALQAFLDAWKPGHEQKP